jgi:hypothetical protein
MLRYKIEKKTSRSIKIKINRNQKNKDQIQNKYKLEDIIEFLKARHKYQISREREREKRGKRKKIHHCQPDQTCYSSIYFCDLIHKVCMQVVLLGIWPVRSLFLFSWKKFFTPTFRELGINKLSQCIYSPCFKFE